MTNTLQFLELFAGIGGLSEGFIENSFTPVAFIEKDRHCCDTLKTRQVYFELKKSNNLKIYNDYLLNKITKEELYNSVSKKILDTVINQEINANTQTMLIEIIKKRLKNKKLDLVLGGPPCQAYSLIGRAQNKEKENDDRIYLYKYYLEFLKKLKPTSFIFENVPGLLSINKGILFQSIMQDFSSIGYKVSYRVLNANDYGVLQNRKRVIVVGNRYKKINLDNLKNNKYDFNVHSIFSDLAPLRPSEEKNQYLTKPNEYLLKTKIRQEGDILTAHHTRRHNIRDLNIYRVAIQLWNEHKKKLKYSNLPSHLKTHKNEHSFLDRYKVVCSDLPATHTLVAHIAKDGHHYIHPDINQCRSLSVREAARIQSFPDNFFFEGPRTSQFIQIGNAVPPLLSITLSQKFKELYAT